jgi:hypothetical protein
MIEALAFTLFKTYVAFLFTQQLRQQETVLIEGAPKWYYRSVDEHLCRSGFAIGDLDAVETAKQKARDGLVQDIDKGVKTVIYEHFREVENPAERELIARFKRDAMLPQFVDSKAQYHNVEYRDEINKGFSRVCVKNNILVNYQKQRLDKIQIAVMEKYGDEAFDELEAENPDTAADIDLENNAETHRPRPHQAPNQDPFLELERETEVR